ncbi:MAG TPA: hypothetical protein VHT30_04160 [Acidimicrobiales bacterium]|jgi:ABC-2 type transport system permease protein|nr:hypothetical protein [Acidimicrobiales bacterium]
MAWVFVRLKARLLANGLRAGAQRVIGTVLGAIYGAAMAAGGFAALAVAGGRRQDGPIIAVLLGATLVVGWAIVPILGFGSDETLDPSRLELLPLGRRDLMTGLLAASVVGIGPIATLIALSGAVVGFAPAGPGAVLVVAAVVIQVLICLAVSRAVVTALSAWLRSRRGRDLRVLILPLVALLPQLLRFIYVPKKATFASFQPLANVVGWVPAVLPMRALAAASQERLAVAGAELVVSVAALAALCWWWARSLERIGTSAEAAARHETRGTPSPAGDSARRFADPLFGFLWAWLPRSRTGAVAAREARVSWRDPRRRVQTVSTVVFPFFVLAGVMAKGVAHRPSLVYAALAAIALGGARVTNQLGMDGRAWWVHEASGADWESDLRGKNLGLALTSLPITAVTAIVLAALSDGWSQLIPVLLLAGAICEVQLAIGNVVSVRAPWGVPESRSNAFASNTGQGCFASLLTLAAMAGLGVLSIPGIAAVILVPSVAGRVVIGAAGLAYGYGWWRLGCSLAVGMGNRRGPEVLAALGQATSAR